MLRGLRWSGGCVPKGHRDLLRTSPVAVGVGLYADGVSDSIHEEERVLQPMLNAEQDHQVDDQEGGDPDGQFQRESAANGVQAPGQARDRPPLIAEAGADANANAEDGEAPGGVDQEPPIQRPEGFRPDVTDNPEGLRDVTKKMGKWDRLAEVGQTLQGQGNAARMRGDHRYGAAAAHGVGRFALSVGTGASAIAGAPAAMTAVGLGSAFAAPVLMGAKAAIGNTLQVAGQTADFIADNRREALDPKGEARQQVLTDLANRHDFGQDSSQELTEDEAAAKTRVAEVDAKGVRFEKNDQAKRVFEGRKRRTGGRLAENAAMSVIKSPWTVLKGLGKSIGGLGKKIWTGTSSWWHGKGKWHNRKGARRARGQAEIERLTAAKEAQANNNVPGGIEAGEAAAPAAPKPWGMWGAEHGIRHGVRAERAAAGQGGGIGLKDSKILSIGDRQRFKALERDVVAGTDKFKSVENKASEEGYKSIIASGRAALDPDRPMPIGNYKDHFDPNQESAVPGALEGLSAVGKYGNDGLKAMKSALPAASMIGTAIGGAGGQGVADVANAALGGIKSANAVTTIPELPLLPIAFEGLKTAADVGQTAFQAAHRDDDPLANASRERQGLTDMRQMLAAQRAMRRAERGEGGDAPQGVAADRTPRSGRLFRAAGRMVLANQKLVKAQAKTGITSLNEYTGQQSNFIANDQMSAEGPLVGSRLAGLGSSLARRFGGRRAAPADLQDLNAENEQLPPPQGAEVEQDVQDQQQEGVGGDSEPDQKPDERQIPPALFDVEKPQPIAGISDGDANLTDADLQMARAMKMNGRSEE